VTGPLERPRHARLARAVGALLAATVIACTPAAPARPNIVFVLVDDLRWDDFGAAGHPFAETPNIDRLAAEGARFLNAFASTPLCSPSRASILTGQYVRTNGIVDNTARDSASPPEVAPASESAAQGARNRGPTW